MSDLVQEIKTMMDLPRTYDPHYRHTWSVDSLDTFIPTKGQDFAAELASKSSDILTTFPYDKAGITAIQARSNPEALQDMRFYRKVLMIGRDALNLVNTTRLFDNEDTRPITTLTATLGEIADKNGRGKKRRHRAYLEAIDAESASQYVDDQFVNPIDLDELRWRYKNTSQADLLNDTLSIHTADGADYHAARRSFRSAVHLGIVSQLIDPSDSKLEYVEQGIELSKLYGKNHDYMLDRQTQKHTSV